MTAAVTSFPRKRAGREHEAGATSSNRALRRRGLQWLLWPLLVLALVAMSVTVIVEHHYQVPLRPDSMRFQRPWAALLLAAPLLVWWIKATLHRHATPRLGFSRLAVFFQVGAGRRRWWLGLPLGLRVSALALLTLGLMGPQSIHVTQPTEVEGIDIIVAIDLSLSMQAADIDPNRFVATKQVVDAFIVRRPNDRIGTVIFGREAYTLLPLTTDKQALRGLVAGLELGAIDGRGTAIGNASGVALNRLRRSRAKSRVVILLTDGESNSGNISPQQAAELGAKMGVKFFTVLMGQQDDAQVQRGRDLFGRALWDRGNFPVNPELLKKMAERTGGEAFQVTNRQQLEDSFYAILDRLEKSQVEDAGKVYGELYPAFVGPAALLLLLEQLLLATWLRRWP